MKNLFLTKTRWLVTIILLTALGSGNVWGAKITDYNNIVSGTEYYIGATTSSTDYYWCSPQTTTGTGLAGIADKDKAKATIVILEGSGTSWKIKIKGTSNYVTLSSSKANGKFNIAESSNNWTFSNASGSIKMLYTRSYCLQKNNNGTQFGSYGGTQTNVWLEEAAPEYTITATRNNDSYGTVEVSGTTITATPAAGYRVMAGNDGYTVTSGTATVVNNGDNTFTVTPSSNCTVQINFEAIPKYTVTLKDDGDTRTQTSAGASVTLPSRDGCAGYTFAGWTKTWVTDQTEWTTTAPTIIPAGSYTPTANENLYPVYTKEEGGGEPVETKTQTFQYDTWEYGGASTDKSSYRLFHDGGYVESASDVDFSKLSKVIVYGGTFGGTSYNGISIKKADGTLWKNATVSGSKETGTNTITGGASLTGSAKLRVYSTKGTASGTGVRISKVEVYTMEGGTTTSYISVPNCCTPLGSINGSVSLSQLATPDPTKLKASWTMNAETGIASYTLEVYDRSDNLVKTINNYTSGSEIIGLTPCTEYYVKLYTVSEGSPYCAGGLIGTSSRVTTNSYTLTVNKSNVTLSSGSEPTNICSDISATYAASDGYTLPTSISVTNAGAENTGWTWNSSTGALTINKANVTGNVTVTITGAAESCSGQYTFDYGGTKQCFSRVGETDEFQITGYTIPTTTTNYWVGYNGYFYNDNLGTGNPKAKSANNLFKYMPVANLQGSPCGGTGEYYKHAAAGAYGTLRIYQNSSADNLYVGFSPAGYQMRIGSGDSWTNVQLTQDGSTWTSDLVTLDAATIAKNYYINVWTGASYSSSDEGVAINNWTDGGSTISSMVFKTGADTWNTTSGLSAGMRGKFRTWTDNCANNGYCHFVPYYRVTYDGSGASGSTDPSADVSCEGNAAARTVVAAANGFTAPTGKTFGGWASSPENAAAGVVAYAAGADVVLTQSIVLYAIWTDINYTVTLTQTPAAGAKLTGGTTTAHYGGTINISTDEPSGYRFNGWTSSPSVTFADASATSTSFTMPDGNVTVTANFVQTHTVTWKVSGKADNEVVYDHGDALVLPSNPSAPTACSEKSFVGWKEGAIDGSTDDRPTMLNPSSPGTVTADKTYYAVFADEGTTFTKVTDPSVFVAGDKIAIVSNDNSYGMRISSNAPAATANPISDAATITPADDQVFTLAGNSTDGFTMSTASRTNEGDVTLGAASVPSSGSEAVILSSSYNTWKFSAHNTSNCILISPSSKSTCGLEYYNGSWKIYNKTSGVASTAACAMRVYRKDLSGYVTTCSECMTPSDLEVSAITSTGATVTWVGVSQTQQAGGSGTGYKVAWNTSNSVPSPLNASNSADVANGTNTYDITGLTAATQYYVFVQSKCDDSWSSSTNFYTNAKITYAAGAGSGSMDSKEVTYNTDATVDACTFTAPSGKKFNGWVSDQSVMVSASSTTSVPDGATITGLTKAITLTAQWRDLANYTVNFSADNGTVAGGTAQTVYEEGRLTFPNVTSTTCGTFIGWVEAAYDNTAAPSGATFHEAGSQIDVVAELDGNTYYAVYRVATGMATNINDELTADKIGTTSYSDWSNLADASAAIYAGNSTKSTTNSNSIQLRSSDNSGIITTTSGGLAKKVTFKWVNGNTSGRIVDIYGKNSAYSSAADLYSADEATQGTKIGSITYNSTTELTISTDYEYIGIRANKGAVYIGSITIQWYGAPMKYQTSPTCSPMVGVESSFSTFTYAYNAGPSASQSFTISGSNLGADLVVTAPENYEVCKTADGTYTSTIRYTPSDGAVANTTAYIRLAAGLNVGTYNYAAASGLQVTSTGAKTRTAALNGSVTKADCAITFTDFNAVDHYEATLEYGSSVTVSYNYTYNGDGNFSISRLPATGTIDKANKTLTVSAAGIWTLNASATAGTNYSKPSNASAQIRVKCVDTYKDFIHNKTIKAYGSGTAVTDGKMEDWGSGYTVPYIEDNAEETSGSCQQTHYKFMGWVSEDDINIADGTFKTGWTLIQAGTESKLATTKTYYAVWAKLEE